MRINSTRKLCLVRPTLLATRKLLNALLFVMFAIEAYADANAGIILHRLSNLLFLRIFITLACGGVGFPLDDQSPTPCRNQFGENAGK